VDFEDNVQHYEKAINSFTLAADMQEPFNEITQDDIEVTTSTDETNSEGGGCLIATATYGSELAPQVQQLRELRDEIVLETESGTAFMKSFNQFYYSFSPTIADMERENPVFKEAVKISITPLLASLSILNYVDIDSEQEMLGYGIGVILMNVGMYFASPAIIIYRLKK
ncbi:MAG TPA: CFI-box-CTERM domain-containing protein, partial [Nitrosopumilaceae archaeon]|nr:CFI-box-CTERM domain-containing protein [Nitrosopumilaceae archaeon]